MKKIILICLVIISALACCAYVCRDISVKNYNGLYVIRIPHERISDIKPHVVSSLAYNRSIYEQTGAQLVVNAGYFDPNNRKTTSYVIIDEEIVLNP